MRSSYTPIQRESDSLRELDNLKDKKREPNNNLRERKREIEPKKEREREPTSNREIGRDRSNKIMFNYPILVSEVRNCKIDSTLLRAVQSYTFFNALSVEDKSCM